MSRNYDTTHTNDYGVPTGVVPRVSQETSVREITKPTPSIDGSIVFIPSFFDNSFWPKSDIDSSAKPPPKYEPATPAPPIGGIYPSINPMTEKRKHNHYFKDVSDLDTIDVYRVLALFNVTDPCLQHAVKKLLVAGGRGVKDITKDVKEAVDTCNRFLEMRQEESKNVSI